MIGNGPYKMEAARTDQEIILVKNDDVDRRLQPARPGTTASTRSRSGPRPTPTPSYNAFEAGEGDNANIPPGRWREAEDEPRQHPRRRDPRSYHWVMRHQDGRPGRRWPGEREAPPGRSPRPSTARRSTRPSTTAAAPRRHRRHPAGHPGLRAEACASTAPTTPRPATDRCSTSGRPRATSSTEPIPIQFNADAGHEPVVAIMVDNLDGHRHRGRRRAADRGDVLQPSWPTVPASICRAGWFADYPTYDNFMFDLFHTDSIGGNNHGPYSNAEFDALIDEAQADRRRRRGRPTLFQRGRGDPAQRGHRRRSRQLVPRRLRLRRRRRRQLPADQLRADPVGAGRPHGVAHRR